MNEPDDGSKCDSVSIVSCSTKISDVTQERDIPDLNSRKLENGETAFTSFDRNKLTKPWNTDGSDMSPIVPVQSVTFTQKSSPDEDSVSEMSEVLVPVISNQSSVTVKKLMFEMQESQQIEESQSLLPQVPTEFHNLNMLRLPSYSKENNTENDGWLTKKADNIKARGGNNKNDFRENVSLIHNSSPRNDISLSQTTVLSSQKDVNSFSQQIDSTSLNDGFIFSQPMVFASEENVLTFSQVDNVLKNEDEISSSQRAVTLTEQKEKDPADRIISRLDRLVSSLDKVSTRQKMVIEVTILQCITNLQDSLNNKLKKQQSTTDNAGIFKRLLQTTQTGLLKLTEKQRLEKLQMSQVGSQSMQQNTQKFNQSALSDFKKRQKRVFSLLKRQKYLVDLFKSRKRSEIATDPYVRFKTDQKHVLSRQSETKQVSKSGNIQPNNTNLKRNHISKTCKKLSTDRESETTNIGDCPTELKREEAKDNNIVKTSEELSKQVCFMRRGIKDSKLSKENMGEGLRNKNIEEEAALGKELKNVYTAGKADEVYSTMTDMTNKGGTGFEDAEDCNLTQDLTTVPDTQDVISQDSVVGNNSDSGDVEDITTDISDKEISECSHDRDNELMEAGANFKMNDTARKDKIKLPSIANTEALLSRVSLKRDIAPVAHSGESIKKSKLDDTEATKVQENVTGKPSSELKTSDMLWLNMVRDDINKKADTVQVPKENIRDVQGMVTSRRLEQEQVDRNNEKPNFQFLKPNVIKSSNLCEAENRSVKLNERKEAVNVPKGNAPVEKSNKTKEQTDESTRKEVVNSDKNTVTVVGLSSPPNLTLPGETWHNISPTATSMSSDVFMVKMKDIQKRMRRRVEVSQNTNIDNIPVVKQVEKNNSEKNDWKVKKVEVFDKQVGNGIQEKDTVSVKIGNDKQEKDTVSEAINAVIQQARDLSKENNGCGQGFENNLPVIHGNHTASHEPFIPRSSALGSEVFTTREMKADTNTKQLQGGLPTLKELVQSGQLTPGKLVLSCFAKGRTLRASLTPVGKIRTQEGFVFVTASQWVSTLTEPVSVKKKKAYEMVLYKGRSLLSICVNYRCNALSNERPTNTATVSTITVDITRSFTEQGTQVKDSDILELLPQKTECEKRLNSLLSNCVVRLLTEQDFVSCDDLPDNFWKEDFSKVRLTKDIWDTVDSW